MSIWRFATSRKFPGQNLVEFALSLPFILIFVYFVTEAGRAWFYYQAIKMAATDGAHTAAIYQNPMVGRQATLKKLQAANIQPTSMPQVTQVPNQHVYQVTVTGNFQPIFAQPNMPIVNAKLFTGFPITYTALKEYTVY